MKHCHAHPSGEDTGNGGFDESRRQKGQCDATIYFASTASLSDGQFFSRFCSAAQKCSKPTAPLLDRLHELCPGFRSDRLDIDTVHTVGDGNDLTRHLTGPFLPRNTNDRSVSTLSSAPLWNALSFGDTDPVRCSDMHYEMIDTYLDPDKRLQNLAVVLVARDRTLSSKRFYKQCFNLVGGHAAHFSGCGRLTLHQCGGDVVSISTTSSKQVNGRH